MPLVSHPNALRPEVTPPARGVFGRVVRAAAPELRVRKWSVVLVELPLPTRDVVVASEIPLPYEVLTRLLHPFRTHTLSLLPWSRSTYDRSCYRANANDWVPFADDYPAARFLEKANEAIASLPPSPRVTATWPIALESRAGVSTWRWRTGLGAPVEWRDTLDREIEDDIRTRDPEAGELAPVLRDLLVRLERYLNG